MINTLLSRFKQKQMRRWLFWLLVAGAVAARLLVALCQKVYLVPEGSGLDDMLMIRAAMRISEGGWLGPYGPFAIAKHMGFAFWLALLHALGVPVLVGNAALWLAACGFAAWAIAPLARGNFARLCVFVFLAFQPVSFAQYTMRVYRDGIFASLSLLFFAGVLGLGLRLRATRLRGSVFAAVVAGLGLAGAWLTREDGAVLLVYAACGLALVLLCVLFCGQLRRRAARVLCVLLPFALLAGGVLAFSAGNAAHYGVFAVSDMTSGSFGGAYGALAAVSRAESGWQPQVPVSKKALQKLYDEVPSMALLRGQLESRSPVFNGFANAETGEYGGSFYFALRLAAYEAGQTPDAPTAQKYWEQMETEVAQAVAEGRLQSVKAGASTLPAWNAALLGGTAAETGRGVLAVLTFHDCNPRPQESVGPAEKTQPVAQYLHSSVQQGYEAGTDIPYYNRLQKTVFLGCDILIWVYRILVWPLLAAALWRLFAGLAAAFSALRKKRAGAGVQLLCGALLLGLLLSFLLRMVVAAYMEVAAFGIGTYLMYLAGGVPPLLLFGAAGLFWRPVHEFEILQKAQSESEASI